MSLEERKDKWVREFKECYNWEDRYKLIIELGKDLSPMNDLHHIEANKVRGCQSQVWLWAECSSEGKIYFEGDSDATLVRGIVAFLIRLYNGSTPKEVIELGTGFIDEIGLKQHLSMGRSNGLSSMLKQIIFYAIAFQGQLE